MSRIIPKILAYPDTWASLEDDTFGPRPYQPTYITGRAYIDGFHSDLTKAPRNGVLIDLGIGGWLRPTDALKLYEMAHFCDGDVLELGTNRGLSAYVLASALKASGRDGQLISVDINPAMIEAAGVTLVARGLADSVELRCADAMSLAAELRAEGRRFGFCFVDHSHTYEAVRTVCEALPDLLSPGGFVLFHDFVDRRNTRRCGVGESDGEYGVFAGVEDGLDSAKFAFHGIFGCSALYRLFR